MEGDKPEKIICLFDVDGTLTGSRQRIAEEMDSFLQQLKTKVEVGVVSGSDCAKIEEQMCLKKGHGLDLFDKLNYVFAENGLMAFVNGILQPTETIHSYLGDEKLQILINFCLEYMSRLVLPCKRGNFIELRSGMINICPIGRSCSQAERDAFAAYDAQHKIREKFVKALNDKFANDYGLNIAIGGQISIDVFPLNWDKTYCLKYLEHFDKIYFFGDKTLPGGNDYELYSHSRTIGYRVDNPLHTKTLVSQIFNLK